MAAAGKCLVVVLQTPGLRLEATGGLWQSEGRGLASAPGLDLDLFLIQCGKFLNLSYGMAIARHRKKKSKRPGGFN